MRLWPLVKRETSRGTSLPIAGDRLTSVATKVEPPRILFVDDESLVLDGLSVSLRRMRKEWSMEFVCGGAAAIARLAAGKVDAVVTDMRMPVVDGEAVLLSAHQHCPGSLRIILSGQTEHSVMERSVRIAHQFLSKPCSADELRSCLQQLLELRAPLDERTRDVVYGVDSLPVSSAGVARLQSLQAERNPQLRELAACIEDDAGLTATLLRVAGAGFFAARQQITSVAGALGVLGSDTALAVLLASPTSAWDHHVLDLAQHARATAELLPTLVSSPDARLLGLLHEVGKLVMLAHHGAPYAALLEADQRDTSTPFAQLERERFGTDHHAVGAHLLALWGIPSAVTDAIRQQSDSTAFADEASLALALHVGCARTRGSTTTSAASPGVRGMAEFALALPQPEHETP